MKKFTKFSRGFTLIELLVVIAIIGILSSIVLASLSTARNKANDAKLEEQMSGLRSAAEIFNSSNAGYSTVATSSTQGYCSTISSTAGGATNCNAGTQLASTFFVDPSSGAAAIMTGIAGTAGVASASGVAGISAWAFTAVLPSGGSPGATWWCVDSSGKSKSESGNTITSSSVASCP